MLWDLFKHLKNIAPIYKDVMDEDENSTPEAYVILEDGTFDEGAVNGDGRSLVRRKSYNIRIHTRTKTKSSTVVTAYRNVLLNQGIQFSQFGPTYDPGTKYYSVLITGTITYGF